jgi:hypothetical protein
MDNPVKGWLAPIVVRVATCADSAPSICRHVVTERKPSAPCLGQASNPRKRALD